MNWHKPTAISALAVLLSYGANAGAETQGLYVGFTAGQSSVDLSVDEFNTALLASLANQTTVASISGSSVDDSDASFGVYIGYAFNPYIGFEIGYVDLGTVSQKTNLDTDLGPITASARFSSSGVTAALVGSYPFAGNFEVHGRGGLNISDTRTQVRLRDSLTGERLGADDDKASDTDLFAGIGLGWNINESYTLRLDYQRFLDVGKDTEEDVDLISLSIVFR